MRLEWRVAISCIVPLVLAAFVVVEVIPWLWQSTWTALPYCGKGRNLELADTVCILFVASPHFMPEDDGMSKQIHHRLLVNIFSSVHSFVSPDIVAFVGNFDDPAAQSSAPDGEGSSRKDWDLHSAFVLPPETPVLNLPCDLSVAAGHHFASGSAVKHPMKLKFVDLMVWPNNMDPEITQRLASLRAYAADYGGSVQMLIGCQSPARPDCCAAILADLKPHMIFSVSDGQAVYQHCSRGSQHPCGKNSRFFDSDAVRYALRSNVSNFIDMQLPAFYELPDKAGNGYMAAQIDLFGEVAIEVLWSPTRTALIRAYVAVAAAAVALTFILSRPMQARTAAVAFAKATSRWALCRLMHLKHRK